MFGLSPLIVLHLQGMQVRIKRWWVGALVYSCDAPLQVPRLPLHAGPEKAPSVPEQVAAITALTSRAKAAANAGRFTEVQCCCLAFAPDRHQM